MSVEFKAAADCHWFGIHYDAGDTIDTTGYTAAQIAKLMKSAPVYVSEAAGGGGLPAPIQNGVEAFPGFAFDCWTHVDATESSLASFNPTKLNYYPPDSNGSGLTAATDDSAVTWDPVSGDVTIKQGGWYYVVLDFDLSAPLPAGVVWLTAFQTGVGPLSSAYGAGLKDYSEPFLVYVKAGQVLQGTHWSMRSADSSTPLGLTINYCAVNFVPLFTLS